jgi:hypothetical protein
MIFIDFHRPPSSFFGRSIFTRTLAVGLLTGVCAAPGFLAVSALFAGKTALSATSFHERDDWTYPTPVVVENADPDPVPPRPADRFVPPPAMLAGPIQPGLGDLYAAARPVGFTIVPPARDERSVSPVMPVGFSR